MTCQQHCCNHSNVVPMLMTLLYISLTKVLKWWTRCSQMTLQDLLHGLVWMAWQQSCTKLKLRACSVWILLIHKCCLHVHACQSIETYHLLVFRLSFHCFVILVILIVLVLLGTPFMSAYVANGVTMHNAKINIKQNKKGRHFIAYYNWLDRYRTSKSCEELWIWRARTCSLAS